MVARVKPVKTNTTSKFIRWTSIVLSVLGAADAIYLLVLKITQNELMCVGNHGCITVNNSIYSEIYGLPVSVLGLIGYLAILLVLLIESLPGIAKKIGPFSFVVANGPLFIFGATLIGLLFSAYLTYIEAFVIYAYCPFCVASAILMTILFVLAIIRLVKQSF
jgi:uncharacterized membrane protein